MRSHITTSDTRHPRAGFSLVEMLVVMAIIALLSTLSFVVLGKSGEIAREASTKATMKILSGAIRERVDAFHEITASASQLDPDLPTKKESRIFRDTVAAFNQWFLLANPSPAPHPLAAEAYVRKTMFKSLFPQREEDLWGYNALSDNGQRDDSPLLARMRDIPNNQWKPDSWKGRNTTTPGADSSELLYLVLTEGDVYGLPPAEIDGIDDNMIGDTDGDGNLEFLDGWGQPLQFYNWPTRLIKDDGLIFTGTVTVTSPGPSVTYPTASLLISNLPQADSAAPVSATKSRNRTDRDPEDPTRSLFPGRAGFYLLYQAYSPSAPGPVFDLQAPWGTIQAPRFNSYSFHDPNTASMPLIVSAGADGVLGLHLPTENGTTIANHADHLARVIQTHEACQALGDNITNQQRGPQ